MDFLTVTLLSCTFLWIFLCIFIIWSWLNTPWYPSRIKHLKELIEKDGIDLKKNAKVIDVGSGEGKVVNWFADQGLRSEGIEFNPYLTLVHRLKNTFRRNKTKVHNKNFFSHKYSDYDIVYMYIYNEYMDKLKDKLYKEMKPGSLIISNVFKFTDIEPDMEVGRFKIYKIK